MLTKGKRLRVDCFSGLPFLCKFCFLSSELRILLLCGSDLLESFCIPGLWNEADVSSKAMGSHTTGVGKDREGTLGFGL